MWHSPQSQGDLTVLMAVDGCHLVILSVDKFLQFENNVQGTSKVIFQVYHIIQN